MTLLQYLIMILNLSNFSSVIDEVKWIVKSREIYSKKLEKKVEKYFLRPNFVNDYNYDMNSVDQADQLRTIYQVTETEKVVVVYLLMGL